MRTGRRTFASLIALAAALPATRAPAQPACTHTPVGTATVAQVRDGRTLLLGDGRELRLVAIEPSPLGRAMLQRLAAGQEVRIETIGAGHDRYGRLTGFVFAGKATQPLQVALLEAGAARGGVPVGSRACAEALLAAEQAARAAELGVWADPNFAPLAAKNVYRLEAERGQFTLVEGKVLSVRTSRGTIYINFRRRWTRDFSVVVLGRRQKVFAATGVDPQQLEGRRIRVRGWIEQRRGPVIEAEWPEQIELIH
jgi:endonuclease YncB( thermonuclease family)